MTRSLLLSWVLVAVWAAWLFAAQGYVSAHWLHSAWVPDLALVFAIGLGAVIGHEDLPKLALALALARSAVSIDPPVANFAAFLGVAALVRAVAGVIDTAGPLPRALLAFASAELVHAWFSVVHRLRVAEELARAAEFAPASAAPLEALASALPTALATALCALIAAPLLARLPGTRPLIQKRRWRVVASPR